MRTHLAIAALLLLASPALSDDKGFAERVAPLLKDRCVGCHNGQKSKGGLDLASRANALRGGEQGPALVPGDAAKSLLVKMVSGAKPEMPRQGKPLTAEQVADIRKWIDAGAPWPEQVKLVATESPAAQEWWSLRKLARPPVPTVKDQGWVRTPIDAFILSALEARGLKPAAEADRATLIRRLTFDLHGLPPTPDDVERALNDKSDEWYARLVDRLLASPRYGERWGRHWLDVVHYGDTHGYDKDKRRNHAWPYRDYVIRSFNQDKLYLRFMREQIAGDVLYANEPDGVVATGFIAAGPWDFVGHVELREGTIDKAKARLLDRDDMLSNAMSTFVSMTVFCARCHDHKFDPIPQKDYYRLQAVFAGVDRADHPYQDPQLAEQRALLVKQQQDVATRKTALLAKVNALSSPELKQIDADLGHLKAQLAALPKPPPGKPSPTNGYHSGIEPKPDVRKWVQVDLGQTRSLDLLRLIPARPTDFPDTPGFGFPQRFRIELSDTADFIKTELVADHTREDFPNPKDAPFTVRLAGRKARYVRVTAERLWKRTNDYVFALAELQIEAEGKNVAAGATVSALDSIEAGRWSKKHLVDGFDSRAALPDRALPEVAETDKKRSDLQAQIDQAEAKRSQLLDLLVDAATKRERASLEEELAAIERKLKALPPALLVYAVSSHAPRPIHLLHRGNVEQPREAVPPGALSALAGLDAEFKLANVEDEKGRRAALADWLSDPRNALVRRSIVNRVWHYHFGRGIVDTPNDFGRNGSLPTHPELLDWLAVEFFEQGGSLKQLHRLILRSSVYRQASGHNAEHARIDADNRYLWRMNRQRLDAESVRDAVLAVSGKLDFTMGGPGFELFRFKDDHSPIYDHGAIEKINDPAGWRRAVYRFTVRSVPNPFLDCLDCADPNINTPVRNTTLTALQALALLNDPFMIKQSELFAERLRRQNDQPARQIEAAYRLALGRSPSADEAPALTAYAAKHGLANACRLIFNMNEFVFVD